MSEVWLVYDPAMATYDLGPSHPLRPERFTLAVSLMRSLALLDEPESDHRRDDRARVVAPPPASVSDIQLVHDAEYVRTVMRASADPGAVSGEMGLGTGDNPASRGMHEASLLISGGSLLGLRAVLNGDAQRTFSIAGGLHHAHRARAAGFCVYNDPAVAIAAAISKDPTLRVAYVDIDAHHGDGVQEAFAAEPRVLTLSVHESGMHIFPGTGFPEENGSGAGKGYALNVPLPPLATDACYAMVLTDVIAPALRSYRPDAIVAQLGADAHHDDPLTSLGQTLPGYRSVVRGIVGLADEVCEGRLAATGGGGYGAYSVVPRAWTLALGELLGVSPAEELPSAWREESAAASGGTAAPERLTEDEGFEIVSSRERQMLDQTAGAIEELRRYTPLLG